MTEADAKRIAFDKNCCYGAGRTPDGAIEWTWGSQEELLDIGCVIVKTPDIGQYIVDRWGMVTVLEELRHTLVKEIGDLAPSISGQMTDVIETYMDHCDD